MNVVSVQIAERTRAIDVTDSAIELDEQSELLIVDVASRAAGHRHLPAWGRQAMRTLHIASVGVFQRALDSGQIAQDV
jgi:hypothetical protein